ncbi:MAG: cupin domain-containing protein [Deltaproteobacteria bacterium]|nr:cupin domain-containing protein [Deltaproteobacteria bacterium]
MKIIIEKLPQAELQARKIEEWPIWECEPSTFDWHYDQREQCYILEGEVTVKTAQEGVVIRPGDFVTFPQGLDCKWSVKKPIRKHYSFS